MHVCLLVSMVTGICTGPRKEFLACLAKSLAQEEGRLFLVCDDNKLRWVGPGV